MENATTLKAHQETIWNRDFIGIFIVNIMMSMGQFMMSTLVPKFTDSLGSTAAVVGLVSSIFALTALGIRPIAGPAMDYFRKNRLLTVAIGIITVAFVIYGFSKTVALIVVARLVHGVGIGVAAPLCLAIASNTLPSNKMASGIGIFSLGQAAATAVGPTIGLKLVKMFGYNMTFFIVSAFMGLCLLLSLMIRVDKPNRTMPFRISLKSIIAPEAVLPAVLMFFLFCAYSCINFFMAIYGGLLGIANIGLFFMTYAICMLISRPFSGKIADKFGIDKTIIPGILIFMISLILIGFARSLPMLLLAAVISALGFGTCEPSVQTLCMQLAPKERRGAASNTNFIGIDCGNLVGPTIAGLLVTKVQNHTGNEMLGYSVMYQLMIIPVLICLAIFLARRKKLLGKILTQAIKQTIGKVIAGLS